ncbi:unnamed protein product [Acanthoscelides obtectus]|nr:unnamed protein product [Acanthoscelides obtectus]CAK1657127.1 E3 SUMO-protein ligase PIAS3 [Acanthoscelides obtectus]
MYQQPATLYPYPSQYAAAAAAAAAAQQQQPLLANQYPVHPDVKFRRLPFYDILADLLKPSSLVPQTNQRMQEGTFYFHLTPQQATDIASSRDIRPGVKNDYIKQVQMRFCLLETTCEQEDYFPPNVIVKVNNKLCPLPNPIPTNKPGVEPKRPPRPVNITQMVKLSPTVANTISVSWATDYTRGYAISVSLVHKLTSSDLLQRLKNKGMKHADHTRALIKEKLSDDGDCEIATTSLRVSLTCPLGKMRMTTPCRSATCSHLQCFDASLYLQMNERKPTWNCPVCDKPSLYDNLVIDGYFQDVLNSPVLPSDCNEIQLNKDGSWSVQQPEKKVAAKVEKTTSINLDDSVVEIIGDDVEIVNPSNGNNTATSTTDKTKDAEPKKADTVDLTLSDSDDDEPLAKRRALNPKPDSTGITSSTATSANNRAATTPGPSSVSSSGYPASPSIINLDSPSPPRSPRTQQATSVTQQQQPASCMVQAQQQQLQSNGKAPQQQQTQQPAYVSAENSMPYLDLENEAASAAGMNYSAGY